MKYHKKKNRRSKKIVFLKTSIGAKKYKTAAGYIRGLLKDESNLSKIKERLEAETPGIFDNTLSPLYGARNDTKKIADFLSEHVRTKMRELRKKDAHITVEQTVKKFFNTRTFVSNEELIQNNLKSFFNKRMNESHKAKFKELMEKQELNRLLKGYTDEQLRNNPALIIEARKQAMKYAKKIDYSQFSYVDRLPGDGRKAYVYGDTGLAVVLVSGSGTAHSPYIFNVEVVGDNK